MRPARTGLALRRRLSRKPNLGGEPRKVSVPRLSCIIPVVGNTDGLEATLVSVLEHRPEDCEILVVLNTPYADPYALQGEVRFIEALGLGRAACATLGVRVSQAPIVQILATGCESGEGCADAALPHFSDPEVAAVAPVIRHRDCEDILAAGLQYGRGGRRIVATRLDASSDHGDVLGPTIDAGFYRKSALEILGDGFPAELGDIFADLDLGLSLRYAGFRTVVEPAATVFAERLIAPTSTGFEYGLHAEKLWLRNLPVSGRLAGAMLHPWTVAGELLRSAVSGATFAQMAGRMAAWFRRADYRMHYQWLDVAREIVARNADEAAPILKMPSRDEQADDRVSHVGQKARGRRVGGA
jgi:hypothetical protein